MISSQLAYLADLGSQIILVLLFAASFFVIAFYVERKLFFKKNFNKNIELLISSINKTENRNDVVRILSGDKSVESVIVLEAVQDKKAVNSDKLFASISSKIDVTRRKWEKFLLYFATVGSNAPFLGLLGTVLGLMQAFSDLALAARPDAKAAMGGISNALITTVAGIVIAIPALIIYNSFSKTVNNTVKNIKALGNAVSNSIY
jgi:biopolymer transport protein ExbB/TolQ